MFFKKKDKNNNNNNNNNNKSNRNEVSERAKNFFNNDKEHPSEIRAVSLTKFYGKRKIIEDISYGVKQGEVVGLLGPNGAGKTTSFYITVGFVTATKGQVFLNDIELTGLHMYKRAQLGK